MNWWQRLIGKEKLQNDSGVTPTVEKIDVKLLPDEASPQTTAATSTTSTATSQAAAAADEKRKLGARTRAIDVFKKMKAQFADPYDLFREIVQNSIDAGTDKTEFTFERQYFLRGDLRSRYVKCFKKELTRDGATLDSIIAGLPEELSVDASGEIKEFHPFLGKGYAQPQLEERFSLGRGNIRSYLAMLQEKDPELLAPEFVTAIVERKNVTVDKFGISEDIVAALPLEKLISYFDHLLEVQKGRELGRHLIYSPGKIPPQLELLIDRRNRYVRERAAQGDLLAEAALAIPREEIVARASTRWSSPEVKLTAAERDFFSFYGNFAAAVPRKLEKVLADAPLKLKITARDYGRGMTNKDREQFLKKIFASSKGKDLEQIGRFGVGFVSVFALNPAAVIVESTRAGESWEYHFLPNYVDGTVPGALYEPETPLEKGTKITLIVDNRTSSEIDTLVEEARKHLLRDCRYVEKPIYFNGEKITTDFDLNTPVKVRFGKKGIEGVIGLVQQDKSFYEVYNNRIRLEGNPKHLADTIKEKKEDGLLSSKGHFGLAIVVSSKYLNYDIARSKVMRDGNFEGIVGVLEDQEEALAKESFIIIEEIARRGYKDSEAERISIRFIEDYLGRRIKKAEKGIIFPKFRKHRRMIKALEELLPDGILDRDLLHTIDEEPWTVRQIIQYVQQGHPILYYANQKTELVAEFQRKGEVVFKDPTGYLRSITGNFAQGSSIEQRFATAKKSETISSLEQAFIDGVANAVRNSPLRGRGFHSILGSHLTPREKDLPYILSYGSGGMLYYDVQQQQRPTDNRLSSWFATIGDIRGNSLATSLYQDTLVINFENPYIQQVMLHEQLYRDGDGYQLFTQLVCAGEYINQDSFMSRLFRKERRRGGRNIYRSGSMNPQEFIRGASAPSRALPLAATPLPTTSSVAEQISEPSSETSSDTAIDTEGYHD